MAVATANFRPSIHIGKVQVKVQQQGDKSTEYISQGAGSVVDAALEYLFANGLKNQHYAFEHELLLKYLSRIDAADVKPTASAGQNMCSSPPAADYGKYVQRGRESVTLSPMGPKESGGKFTPQPSERELEETKSEQDLLDKSSYDTKVESGQRLGIIEGHATADVMFREQSHDTLSSNSRFAQSAFASSSQPQTSQYSKGETPVDKNDYQSTSPKDAPDQEEAKTFWRNATLRDILAYIRNDLGERAAHRSNDAAMGATSADIDDSAASINTRNETWTISSFRTNKSFRSDPNADSIFDSVVPPDTPYNEDWSLPLESLLKPIKKNTYSPITQDQVQQFLAGAKWADEPSEQEKNETLWTAKTVPLRKVEQRSDTSPWVDEGDIPRRPGDVDLFLESIEDKGEAEPPNQCMRHYRPRTSSESSRERQYPGPTVLYAEAEYFGERLAGDTRHRVYIKQLSTQSPTPDYYRRHRNSNVAAGATVLPPSEFTPEAQPPSHKVLPHPFFVAISLTSWGSGLCCLLQYHCSD
jgi:hypothetical protein